MKRFRGLDEVDSIKCQLRRDVNTCGLYSGDAKTKHSELVEWEELER